MSRENVNIRPDIGRLGCLMDLHHHLDGSITPAIAKKLAKLQNIEIPADDAELTRLLQIDENCKSLNDYLARFEYVERFLQTGEGLALAAREVLLGMVGDGVMYTELRFAPFYHTQKGMSAEDAVRAVLDGIKDSPFPCGIILCCMRGRDLEENLKVIELAAKYLEKGVVAADLAGAEALYPTRDYAEVFGKAEELGIPFTIHAGEAAGPESVKEALELHPQRIGHGIRSVEDEELVARLAKLQIPLELCPTSNLDTKIYEDIKDYPIRKLIGAGVKVTVNTDDKAISNTDIRREFSLLADTFDFTADEIKQLLLNQADAAFADEKTKLALKAKIESELAS